MRNLEALVDAMSLSEQVALLSGQDSWSVAGNQRIGFAPFKVTDGPNGARGGGSLIGGVTAAAFPVGIALGASWNTELAAEIGSALAGEVRSKGARVLLAPTVNIQRSVSNGRNFECYSEDPVLTAKLATAYISGLQKKGVSATIKHFAGNETEIERTTVSSEIDERTLREIYLLPFEAAVKTAGTWAIMSAYNKLNGTYCAENHWLLTKVLRDDWNYTGIVMSDWFGSRSTAPTINAGLDLEMPGPTRDRGDKLIKAVEAGEVMPETVRESALRMLRLMERTGGLEATRVEEERAEDLPQTRALIRRAGAESMVLLKNNGILPLDAKRLSRIAVIGPNAKTARIMGGGSAQLNPHYSVSPWDGLVSQFGADRLVFAEGASNHRYETVIEGPFKAEYFANMDFSGTPAHVGELTQSIAFFNDIVAEGKVDEQAFSARFTGSYTPDRSGTYRVGGYAAGYLKVFIDDRLIIDATAGKWQKGHTFFEEGCDEVIGAIELEQERTYRITIELTSKPSDNISFTAFSVGIGFPLGESAISEAASLASNADVALVFVGRSGEWDTEGSDLTSLALPGRQNELISAVAQANPKTIVILQSGGPIAMPWLDDIAGLLEAWYPGQELGNAVADVLSGTARTGRAAYPQSFPVRWEDNPTQSQDLEVYPGLNGKVRYEEGVFIGYRHYDKAGIVPLFPLRVRAFLHAVRVHRVRGRQCAHHRRRGPGPFRHPQCGARAGSSVVQIYVHDIAASVPRPKKELKAFAKLALAAGEGRTITLELKPRDFAFYDVAAQCWRIEKGEFEILAGFSSAEIVASAAITVKGRHPASGRARSDLSVAAIQASFGGKAHLAAAGVILFARRNDVGMMRDDRPFHNPSIAGNSVSPSGVNRYSTRGGISGYMVRITRPSRSRFLSVRVSIRCEMPPISRLSVLKRTGPFLSRPTTMTLHLSPIRLRTSLMAVQFLPTGSSVSDMASPAQLGNRSLL